MSGPKGLVQLGERVRKHGLESRLDEILASARVSTRLAPAGERVASSRLGGATVRLADPRWPRSEDRPLSLLADLDLAEIGPGASGSGLALPESGRLAFFYDVEEQPWGGGSVRQGWEVRYSPAGESASEVACDGAPVLAERAVGFVPEMTIPPLRSIESAPLQLDEADYDRYRELRNELLDQSGVPGPLHRLGGHPDSIQGCMQRTLQFETRGLELPRGVHSWYEHPRAAELMPGAHEWRLLLQIDTDDDLGPMWGDDGRLFFWIHSSDLAARRFERAWLVLQCY